MNDLELIILYGGVGTTSSRKYQSLINEELTCGYREYARCADKGMIVYMAPQVGLRYPWETCLPNWKDVVRLCKENESAKVWSIKYDESKSKVLQSIPNFKIHYSCCAKNTCDRNCDISLVDTPERVKKSAHRLFFKGKDPSFWKPGEVKKYDYVLCGKRDDKNQSYFINALNAIDERRSVLWIGGSRFSKRVKSKHKIKLTDPLGPRNVSKLIAQARVGILFSNIPTEGFPQTLLEMTMCGVPVVYNGPVNSTYIHKGSCVMPRSKKKLVNAAEKLLFNHNSELCRQIAIDHYSMEKSLSFLRKLS